MLDKLSSMLPQYICERIVWSVMDGIHRKVCTYSWISAWTQRATKQKYIMLGQYVAINQPTRDEMKWEKKHTHTMSHSQTTYGRRVEKNNDSLQNNSRSVHGIVNWLSICMKFIFYLCGGCCFFFVVFLFFIFKLKHFGLDGFWCVRHLNFKYFSSICSLRGFVCLLKFTPSHLYRGGGFYVNRSYDL